jgi:catechol 2,3-dioxygenase-like lactoylglutathione lyase family enzyme
MFHHFSYAVRDINKSKEFYDKTLQCLGTERIMDFETPAEIYAGYGKKGGFPVFWLIEKKSLSPRDQAEDIGKSMGFHIALAAPTKEAIAAWYEAGLKAGGTDNGAPGEREDVPGHYAAFLVDPDGWRLEAVLAH